MSNNVKRIISGTIFMIILVGVLLIHNTIVDSVFVTLLSMMGIYEYNRCFKLKGHNVIPGVGYLSCLAIGIMGTGLDGLLKINIVRIAIPILLVYMALYIVLKELKVSIVDVAVTVLSVVYVPFMFSFIKELLLLENGRIYAILAFACAIMTDTFAYEFGSRIGKHKLSPVVSPKKSIEGSVAGIIGAVISYIIIGVIANKFAGTNFNLIVLAVMAVILSISGQIGDLFASAIKRYCGQKDFGKIMPGHGGILDRFDSVMFVAPMLYALIYIFNLI